MTEATNVDRAEWARAALDAFMGETGCEPEEALGDLLCDLMHFAKANNQSFARALRGAKLNFEAEAGEERERTRLAPGRIARLEETLRGVRLAIAGAPPGVLADTLFMPGPCPETAVDHIDAALAEARRRRRGG